MELPLDRRRSQIHALKSLVGPLEEGLIQIASAGTNGLVPSEIDALKLLLVRARHFRRRLRALLRVLEAPGSGPQTLRPL
jgi:hypothetical protein